MHVDLVFSGVFLLICGDICIFAGGLLGFPYIDNGGWYREKDQKRDGEECNELNRIRVVAEDSRFRDV